MLEERERGRRQLFKYISKVTSQVEKYHVSLKKLLQQGISNPEFYEHLVYEFMKIFGNPNFSDLFK